MASLIRLAIYGAFFAVLVYFTKQYFNGNVCESDTRIDGKTVVITGANTGIGKETAIDIVKRGGRVILACRSLTRATQAADDIKNITGVGDDRVAVMKLDLASFKSIREFAKEYKAKEKRLDILINNAGVMWLPRSETEDGFEMCLGVNHLGHFLLTNLLADVIIKSAPSRVVTVSSMASDFLGIQWDDMNFEKEENFGLNEAYCQSKCANVLFSKELGKRLKGTGVTTYSLHPGAIVTELQRHVFFLNYPGVRPIVNTLAWPFFKTTMHGAQTQICCAVDENLAGVTGRYYSDVREKAASSFCDGDDDAARLWDISVGMAKLQENEIHPKLNTKK